MFGKRNWDGEQAVEWSSECVRFSEGSWLRIEMTIKLLAFEDHAAWIRSLRRASERVSSDCLASGAQTSRTQAGMWSPSSSNMQSPVLSSLDGGMEESMPEALTLDDSDLPVYRSCGTGSLGGSVPEEKVGHAPRRQAHRSGGRDDVDCADGGEIDLALMPPLVKRQRACVFSQ